MAILLNTTPATEAEVRRLLAARDREAAVKLLLPAVESALSGAKPAARPVAADPEEGFREPEVLETDHGRRHPDQPPLLRGAISREFLHDDPGLRPIVSPEEFAELTAEIGRIVIKSAPADVRPLPPEALTREGIYEDEPSR